MAVVRRLTTFWQFKVEQGKVDKFVNSVSRAKKNVDKVSLAVGKLGKQVRGVGKMFAVLGGGITAGLILPGLKLQDSLKDTMTMVNATGSRFIQLEEGMRSFGIKLSNELGMAASLVNEGFYQVLSTGAEALSADFVELSDVGMKLAKVAKLMPAEAVERLADSVNSLNRPMTDARAITDRFFRTTQLASLDLSLLTQAMKEAGPVTGSFGLKLEETLAVLGMFAQGGIKGARAGTSFRMIISKLSAPTGEAAKLIDDLGTSMFDSEHKMRPLIDVLQDYKVALSGMTDETKSMVLKTIMGEEAASSFIGLLNKEIPTMRAWVKELEIADGALERAFVIRMSSGLQQLAKLRQLIVNTSADIGIGLIPTINEMGERFSFWMKENRIEIEHTGEKIVESVGSGIETLFDWRKALITTAKITGAMWVTTKVVAFGRAVVGVVAAFGPIIDGFAAAAFAKVTAAITAATGAATGSVLAVRILAGVYAGIALTIYGVARAFQEMFRAKKAFDDYDKSERKRDESLQENIERRRVQILKKRIALGNLNEVAYNPKTGRKRLVPITDPSKIKSAATRRSVETVTGMKFEDWFAQQIAARKLQSALDKETEDTDLNLGNMNITGGDKLKSKLEQELKRIFEPGFSKDLKLKFRDFLMGNEFGNRSILGAYRNVLGRDIRPETLGAGRGVPGGGAGGGSSVRSVTYNIRGADPRAIGDEIEQRERAMAQDFGVAPLVGVNAF